MGCGTTIRYLFVISWQIRMLFKRTRFPVPANNESEPILHSWIYSANNHLFELAQPQTTRREGSTIDANQCACGRISEKNLTHPWFINAQKWSKLVQISWSHVSIYLFMNPQPTACAPVLHMRPGQTWVNRFFLPISANCYQSHPQN